MNTHLEKNTEHAASLLCISAWVTAIVFSFIPGWDTESLCKEIKGCISADQDYMPIPSKGNTIIKTIHFTVPKKTDIDKFSTQVLEIESSYRRMGFVSKFMAPPKLDIQVK